MHGRPRRGCPGRSYFLWEVRPTLRSDHLVKASGEREMEAVGSSGSYRVLGQARGWTYAALGWACGGLRLALLVQSCAVTPSDVPFRCERMTRGPLLHFMLTLARVPPPQPAVPFSRLLLLLRGLLSTSIVGPTGPIRPPELHSSSARVHSSTGGPSSDASSFHPSKKFP